MNLRNLPIGIIFLASILFGFSGCGEWKPLDHSIGKHSSHHHGAGAKQHQDDHPSD